MNSLATLYLLYGHFLVELSLSLCLSVSLSLSLPLSPLHTPPLLLFSLSQMSIILSSILPKVLTLQIVSQRSQVALIRTCTLSYPTTTVTPTTYSRATATWPRNSTPISRFRTCLPKVSVHAKTSHFLVTK